MTILLPGSRSSLAPRAGGESVKNYSTAQQAFTAATKTYVTGSQVQIPDGGLKVGSKIRFKLNLAKTAAGVATSLFELVIGTLGTIADTTRASFTKPAGTAAADEGVVTIEAVVRSISATGTIAAEFVLVHNLAATGHAQVPVVAISSVPAAFDTRALGGQYIGLCLTTGAADVATTEVVEAVLEGV